MLGVMRDPIKAILFKITQLSDSASGRDANRNQAYAFISFCHLLQCDDAPERLCLSFGESLEVLIELSCSYVSRGVSAVLKAWFSTFSNFTMCEIAAWLHETGP